jgi:hypothetical protein
MDGLDRRTMEDRRDEPKEYFPLTDQVVHDHLAGKLTAGVYPLLTDETCWFLAADFDKATWQDDVRAFLQARFQAEENTGAALEKYRRKIVDQFFPARGDGKLKLGEARKAIRDYRKVTGNLEI